MSINLLPSWKITFKFTSQISAQFIKSARRANVDYIAHGKPRYDPRGPDLVSRIATREKFNNH